MSLDISNKTTIIGWVVTFALGVISTLLTQKLSKKKRRIGWSLVNESNLLSEASLQEVRDGFGVPIEIKTDGKEVTDISTIRIKIVNIGNVELENIKLHFLFGEDASVYVGRYITDLGVYKTALKLEKKKNSAILELAHINKRQQFEIEFLVGNYHAGDFNLDMAESGISLRRVSNFWTEEQSGILKFIAPSIPGIHIDRTAMQTSLLVEEIKGIKTLLSKHLQ